MGSKEEFMEYVLKRKGLDAKLSKRKEQRKQYLLNSYLIKRSDKYKKLRGGKSFGK